MDIQKTLDTYQELMEEIKGRHQLLMHVTAGRFFLPNWAVAEFGQLQIRKICELLAIACLLANGDIEATHGKLARSYEADKIFNTLGKLHQHFYPRASRQIETPGKPMHIEMIDDGFLTKEELIKSYHFAAHFLHRGTLRSILEKTIHSTSREAVMTWCQKLTVLLNHHLIYLVDPPGIEPIRDKKGNWFPHNQLVVLMQDRVTGRVQANHFKTLLPGDPAIPSPPAAPQD